MYQGTTSVVRLALKRQLSEGHLTYQGTTSVVPKTHFNKKGL